MCVFHVSEKSILPRVGFFFVTQLACQPDQAVNRALVSVQIGHPREPSLAWLAGLRIDTITTIS